LRNVSEATFSRKSSFKQVNGLYDADGMSLQSIDDPDYYLSYNVATGTISSKTLISTSSDALKAATFYKEPILDSDNETIAFRVKSYGSAGKYINIDSNGQLTFTSTANDNNAAFYIEEGLSEASNLEIVTILNSGTVCTLSYNEETLAALRENAYLAIWECSRTRANVALEPVVIEGNNVYKTIGGNICLLEKSNVNSDVNTSYYAIWNCGDVQPSSNSQFTNGRYYYASSKTYIL
jgi:hypothetical protein